MTKTDVNKFEIPSASLIICASKDVLRTAMPASGLDVSEIDFNDDSCDYLVCMQQRSARSSFMADALVFPGGALEPEDRQIGRLLKGEPSIAALKVCGVRETFEESGLCLLAGAHEHTFPSLSDALEWRHRVHEDAKQFEELLNRRGPLSINPDDLHLMCRFVTPELEAQRGGKGFDAWFFVANLTAPQLQASLAVGSDRKETSSFVWKSPSQALAMHARGEAFLVQFNYPVLGRERTHTDSQHLG